VTAADCLNALSVFFFSSEGGEKLKEKEQVPQKSDQTTHLFIYKSSQLCKGHWQ